MIKGTRNICENSSVLWWRGLSISQVFHILSFFAETVVLRHSEKNRGLGLCLNLILSQIISSLRVSAASYHQSHIFITQPRMSHTGVTEYVLACIECAHVSPQRTGRGFPAKSEDPAAAAGNPIDGSPPGSPVPGILQVRTLEWVAWRLINLCKKLRFQWVIPSV